MLHIDLFAGIGGFSIAAQRCGIQTVAAVEINPYCAHILRKNFPKCKVINADIQTVRNPLSLLPASHARTPHSQTQKAPARKGKKQPFSVKRYELLGKWDPNTSSWKTCQGFLFEDSKTSFRNFPKQGLAFGGGLYLLKRLDTRSGAKGCLSLRLARPLASDWKRWSFSMKSLKKSITNRRGRKRGVTLAEKLANTYNLKITTGFNLLMLGFPNGWLNSDLELLETPSNPTWQKSSSLPSSISTIKS